MTQPYEKHIFKKNNLIVLLCWLPTERNLFVNGPSILYLNPVWMKPFTVSFRNKEPETSA
jgi:hypothetical protein